MLFHLNRARTVDSADFSIADDSPIMYSPTTPNESTEQEGLWADLGDIPSATPATRRPRAISGEYRVVKDTIC